MTRAYVLDRATRDVLGLVDQSWERLAYTRRYFGMDTFELTINRSRLWASEIQKGRLLYLPDEGDRLFYIEQVHSIAEGSAANDTMMVAGRSLEGPAMAERRTEPDAGQSHDRQTAVKAETAIKHYVRKHAADLAVAARQLPSLVVAADLARGPTITAAGRYQSMFDTVAEIGLLSGIGWEIVYNAGADTFEFDVIVGVDRHASVFFDFAFDSLERWEEFDSLVDSKTVAIVAGQGEGEEREIVKRWLGSEPTGFDRREAFLDARDVAIGDTAVLNMRGDAFLAASAGERRLEAGIHQYGSFKYGEQWDLGDLVLIRNEGRGISYTARVVEVEKSITNSAAAPEIKAVIDRPFPTAREQSEGASAGTGEVDYPSGVPSGSIVMWGGAAAPVKWLLCDGASYLRGTYADLFAAIGTTYGAADGTHFNVPDLRQRFPLGKAVAGTGSTLGSSGGAIDHTHTGPSHQHTSAAHTHTGPSHQHTSASHGHSLGGHTHAGPSHAHTSAGHTHTMASHTHTGPSHTHGFAATHQHDYPVANAGVVRGASPFGDGGTFGAAGSIATSSNNAATRTMMKTEAVSPGTSDAAGTGATGGPSTDTSGSTTPADTGAAGTGATGGPSANSDLTTPADTGAAGTGATGSTTPADTGAAGTGATGSTTPADTGAAGTGATGIANPPFLTVNFIIKT